MSYTMLSVPIGTILDFAGSAVPDGYKECDGSALSRTNYSKLFAVIGTTWGSGDGSTTFNIPNLKGRCTIGVGTGDAGGATAHNLGTRGGDERYQSHSHGNDIAIKTPALSHSITQPAFTVRVNGSNQRVLGISASTGGTGYAIGAFSTGYTVDAVRTTNVGVSQHAAANCTKTGGVSSAGSGSGGNMMPFGTVKKIIKVQ